MGNATSNTTSGPTSAPADKQVPIRSPSYPNMSLQDAVVAVGKIEARYRMSAVDRADAAKLLNFSGLSGPANMALSALAMYGLVERAGKGEIRVTQRARSILWPDYPTEKREALSEAALSPQLYRDLRERFRDIPVPPEDGVVTYLNRQGFNPTAIRPAARAFLQTMTYLEEFGATESHGPSADQLQESASSPKREEPPMHTIPQPQTFSPGSVSPPTAAHWSARHELTLNEPNLSVRGGKVLVEALLDFDGLTELEDQIKALKMILKPRKTAAQSAATLDSAGQDKPIPSRGLAELALSGGGTE